ncbi:MAG: helix-turn-helix transcriptional regulator [Clostridia bacterium]|nr:helix-turn-helix transcriptional regulator [Clostridia bacterium]
MYKITQIRNEKNLSQRALAKLIGASPKAVNFWENGSAEPSAKFIIALANVFECSTDYLLGREDDLGNVNVMRELTDDEKFVLSIYSKLDKKRRGEALSYLEYLSEKN